MADENGQIIGAATEGRGGVGGGGLASAIIGAVGNIASTIGAIINSKETTKQAAINKEIAALQVEAANTALDVEKQKTLQKAIDGKKAELIAVKRSENIKTFSNTAMVFGAFALAALVAYWTLRPAKVAAAVVAAPAAAPSVNDK